MNLYELFHINEPTGRKEIEMAISNKKVIEAAKVISQYCNEQTGCQNCIFRVYGCEVWHCTIGSFELHDILKNIEAKKKNHGYL